MNSRPEPRGAVNTDGINEVSMDPSGAAFTNYDKVCAVWYRVPIIDRTRCPVHTAATAMQTVAMPIRPIRQAYSLEL